MQNLVVFGSQGFGSLPFPARQSVTVDGLTIGCGLVPSREPAFDPNAPEAAGCVFLEVTAFSCNYRDKAFVRAMRDVPSQRFSGIGSEFAGRVVAVAGDVEDMMPGDRVVSNHHFTGAPADDHGVRGGIPSNQASRRHHILPASKLRRLPGEMPDEVAATFSLNAQTAYSMVRRVDPVPGANVLVTSGASNTSLFIITALRQRKLNVFTATSSIRQVPRLMELGVRDVLSVGRHLAGFRDSAGVSAFAESVGGFDYVFDPFFDLHVEKAVEVLNPFGKYITCGLVGQNEHVAAAAGVASSPPDSRKILLHVMTKNLSIIGNCIGLSSDLDAALRDYAAGLFRPVIDSVYSNQDVAPFLNRTFNDSSRFGKVVFRYSH